MKGGKRVWLYPGCPALAKDASPDIVRYYARLRIVTFGEGLLM
jgi:hypothetical protein